MEYSYNIFGYHFLIVVVDETYEWKGAFMTHMGSFKPTVIFFGMTNSPATFQVMMNEILRDLCHDLAKWLKLLFTFLDLLHKDRA